MLETFDAGEVYEFERLSDHLAGIEKEQPR